ncbi:MAG: aminopeptidase [Tenuifilaceae bacterium]|nr:aminopeptidase [Tenuifilaceae bacterium]
MENSELRNSSIIALRDCMGLKPNETLLIVTDEVKSEIGQALHEVGKTLCKESMLVEIKSREINGQEPPEAVAQLMKMVDVVVCPTVKSLTHTDARRNAVKEGVRVGTMPGITVDAMARCLSADYDKIISLTDFIAEKMEGISTIRVVTEKGTDVTMPVKDRMVIRSKGVLREKGESGNLPSGEVYLAPWEDKTNGKLVIDGSMASVGMIKTPIVIDIVDGYAKTITGGEEAQRLTEILDKSGPDARAVAEFGIGTNYKAKLTGLILEDEKVFGTIHIAFGNNLTMGGRISVSSHLDGLVTEPDVYFDDELIMKKGKMLGFEI